MKEQDINLRRAIHHFQEGAHALKQTVAARHKLREAYGLEKADGSSITPTDLYNAANQMSAGYGGTVGAALRQAANLLYKAHQAFASGTSQQPVQAAPASESRRQPSRPKLR